MNRPGDKPRASKVKRDRQAGASLLLFLAEQIIAERAMLQEHSNATPVVAWEGPTSSVGGGSYVERPYGTLTLTVTVENIKETNEAIDDVTDTLQDTNAERSLGNRLALAERMYLTWFERYEALHRTVNGAANFSPAVQVTKRQDCLGLARKLLAEGGHNAKTKALATLVVELLSESGS